MLHVSKLQVVTEMAPAKQSGKQGRGKDLLHFDAGEEDHTILHTDFLTPPVLEEAFMALEKLADVKAMAQGAHPQADTFL